MNNGGSGGEGVHGYANSTAATGVFAGFTGGNTLAATGWALFSNGWAGGTTAWQNISDIRLKRNITTIDGALNKVLKLRGVEYYFNQQAYPDVNLGPDKQIGFIAQEVEQILPNIIRNANIYGGPKTKSDSSVEDKSVYQIKSFSYTDIIPLLVEAMKEQHAIFVEAMKEQQVQIEELKQKVEELERR
ncbi:MAG: tail fiber domain-containing protein [Bacteroidota bacterium]|nr:tail fiber domain-containing protein [Bacteroidota bacterium]